MAATSNDPSKIDFSGYQNAQSSFQQLDEVMKTILIDLNSMAVDMKNASTFLAQMTTTLNTAGTSTNAYQQATKTLGQTFAPVNQAIGIATSALNAYIAVQTLAIDNTYNWAQNQLDVWNAQVQVIEATNNLTQAQAMQSMSLAAGNQTAINASGILVGYAQTQLEASKQGVAFAQLALRTAPATDYLNAIQNVWNVVQQLVTSLALLSIAINGTGAAFGIATTSATAFAISIAEVTVAALAIAVIATAFADLAQVFVDMTTKSENWSQAWNQVTQSMQNIPVLGQLTDALNAIAQASYNAGQAFGQFAQSVNSAIKSIPIIGPAVDTSLTTPASSLSATSELQGIWNYITTNISKQLTSPSLTSPFSRQVGALPFTTEGWAYVHPGEVLTPAQGPSFAAGMSQINTPVNMTFNVASNVDVMKVRRQVSKGLADTMKNAMINNGSAYN
jgi:hypothetical protein